MDSQNKYHPLVHPSMSHYPTDAARVISEIIIPEWLDEFIMKNSDYGNTFALLGSKGQFGDIWRKVNKLKRSMWDGIDMNYEGTDEMLRDLIGHCALALYLRNYGESHEVDEV